MVLPSMLEDTLIHRFQLLQLHLAVSLRFSGFHSTATLHVHRCIHGHVVPVGVIAFVNSGTLATGCWTVRNGSRIGLAWRRRLRLRHHNQLVGIESLTLRHVHIHVDVDRQEFAWTILKL